MENHPIPQDVTGFKFKLIGSVTVKQFLYLVAGGILAAVFFMVPLPGIIKYPISFLCGGIGAALAFIPIDGRPMDVMMRNFLKALPAENQYIYKKRGAEALIAEFFAPPPVVTAKAQQAKPAENNTLDAKRALLYKTLRHASQPDEKEQAVLSTINSYLVEASHSASPPVQNIDAQPQETPQSSSPLVQVVIPSANVNAISESERLTKTSIVKPIETPVAKPAPAVQAVEEEAQKPQFVEQAPPLAVADTPAKQSQPDPKITAAPESPIPATAAPITTKPAPQPAAPAVAPNESASVITVNPESSLKAGFPQLPDTPNIVMGIIKDPRGKIIPNILVEIMDPQGIPVRAFKTNALGQFAAATPLPNGEYNVILEDPRKQNEFEQIHITLDGQIFQPLEIISIDQREKLRRELFGGTGPQPTAGA